MLSSDVTLIFRFVAARWLVLATTKFIGFFNVVPCPQNTCYEILRQQELSPGKTSASSVEPPLPKGLARVNISSAAADEIFRLGVTHENPGS
jgi:hypothetical protein